jgi:hypothetical protein
MNYKIRMTRKPEFTGEEFVATGPWTSECTEAYNRLKQTKLLLHPYDGWKFAGDLAFLRDLWRIESFRLFNTYETDLTPLYEKAELEKLNLLRVRVEKKKPGLDFSRLPNLKTLNVLWMPGMFNLEQAKALEYLQVWGFTGFKHWDVSMMPQLQVLEVHGARSVESICVKGLKKLRSITLLAMPRLKRLDGIEDLEATPQSWLRIDGSKHLVTAAFTKFQVAKHVSLEGKQIIREGVAVRPWPKGVSKS